MRASRAISTVAAVAAVVAVTSAAQAMSLGSWSPAVNAESIPGTHAALNSTALDGCPFVAQRGDILYFASGRAGGAGNLDIWYSLRNADGAWGDPALRGRGYAAEAMAAMLDWATAELGITRFLVAVPSRRQQGELVPIEIGPGRIGISGDPIEDVASLLETQGGGRADGPT